MKRLALVLAFIGFIQSSAIAAELDDVGVVMMHGWGLLRNPPPGRIDFTRRIEPLSAALRSEGVHVIQEEMPWGPNRIIDAPVDTAMAEIDKHVERLKQQGAKRIVITGHSMGAPMALAYAARREGVAGVIGLAPGHHPELMPAMYPDFYPKQIAKAKEAIAAGKGNDKTAFKAAQCCVFYQTFWTTPNIYLSYFDPNGPGTMAGNAEKVRPEVSVLMVYGNKDVIFKLLEDIKESYFDYVPSRLKPNSHHQRIKIDSDHGSVPELAKREVIEWLNKLPKPE